MKKSLLLLLVILLFSGCVQNMESGLKLTPCHDCNVILISLDSVRPDHMSVYGYERETTPFLDLIENKTVFEKAIAPTFYTPPSHATMLTGVDPHEHGVINFGYEIPENIGTIADQLSEKGYYNIGIVNVEFLSEEFNFNKGFDEYTYLQEGIPANSITNKIIESLEKLGEEKRFFVFGHYFQLHDPYQTTAEYSNFINETYDGVLLGNGNPNDLESDIITDDDVQYVRDVYDGNMLSLDDGIKQIWDFLKKRKQENNTIIIITGDHGELLGEEYLNENIFGHLGLLYPLLKVPLVVISPSNNMKVDSVVGLNQIVELIQNLLGFKEEFVFKEEIYSFVPLLEDVIKIYQHNIKRFLVYDNERVETVILNNLSKKEFEEERSSKAKRAFFFPSVQKEIKCDDRNYTIFKGGFSTESELSEKSKLFIEMLDCSFLSDSAILPSFVIIDDAEIITYFYSLINNEYQALMNRKGEIYYFNIDAWDINQTIHLEKEENIISKAGILLKIKNFIEKCCVYLPAIF